ncbi:MAG: Nitroreductase [Rhodobacteraceae bacterium HLUCCA12]|nr:MAG: Nitroreductase [Rhodobacteraceae bacterium HLUCCA12]
MTQTTQHDRPDENPQVMDFLLNRRSRPAKMLRAPAPDAPMLRRLLTAATRVPDHGKLEPWRLVVLEPEALARLAALIEARGAAQDMDPAQVAKAAQTFRGSPMVVAVVAAPKPSEKIPEIEQILSAGAVCLSLLNASLAQGFGACWLTGWPAFDRPFLEQGLGLTEDEQIAGFIHIGTSDATPPDRPRPDLDALVTWLRA